LRHTPKLLILILVGAVVLRLAYILFAGHTLSLQASGYDPYAVNLMAGHGYTRFDDLRPDSDLPPLYPFFLVGVYSTLGRSAVNVALVQIIFDVVTITAIYAIGRRVGGPWVGLLAAAFTAFYPYLLFQGVATNDTTLFIMLLTVGVWGIYHTYDRPSWRWALFIGLMFGVAALTKTLVVLMLPLVALWWWRHHGFRRAVGLSLVAGVALVAVVMPWVIRNTQVQGTLTLISTNDGSNLYQGNNPCVADYLLNGWDAQWVQCLEPIPDGLSETEGSTWYRDQALAYLRNNPGDIPRLLVAKLYNLWSPELLPRTVPPSANLDDNAVLQYEQPLFQLARLAHLIYFAPLLVLALVGIGQAFRARTLTGLTAPLLMVLITITVAYLVYHPSTRYRSPADPFVFVLAATAVQGLVKGRKRVTDAATRSMS
jgi:4-amino-4-deoxy-L-arabinose transferase-like glycosyltransferase